jgi:hypothetical protein
VFGGIREQERGLHIARCRTDFRTRNKYALTCGNESHVYMIMPIIMHVHMSRAAHGEPVIGAVKLLIVMLIATSWA